MKYLCVGNTWEPALLDGIEQLNSSAKHDVVVKEVLSKPALTWRWYLG